MNTKSILNIKHFTSPKSNQAVDYKDKKFSKNLQNKSN